MVAHSRDGRLDTTLCFDARISSRHQPPKSTITTEPYLLMKKQTPTIIQAIGTIMVAMSLSMIAIPLGLGFAGIALMAFGIAAERV